MRIKIATRRLLSAVVTASLLASLFLTFGAPARPTLADGEILISEIRIDQTGTDNDEYFELVGAPGTSLDSFTYLVIGDGTGGSGVIEAVVNLTGQTIPPSGYFVAAESTFTLGTANLVASLNFENDDNVTHLLVSGFSGANGNDLDTNDDGVLDVTPWTQVLDLIALIEEENPPSGTEYHYGPPTVGPDGSYVPGHAFLCAEGWQIGQFDPAGGDDTPGAANACGGPDYTPIHDIQFTTDPSGDSPLKDQVGITTEGIVTARFQYGYFIEDPAGGAWNGLWVYDANAPALGDRVRLTGTVVEYYNLTELNNLTDYNVLSSGNPLPDPIVLPTAAANDEQYEGVLVRVENVTVTNPDLGNGEWSVSDGSGDVVIDDKGDYTYVPVADDAIDAIIGPLDYTYGAFKIQPRDDGDILLPTTQALVINELDADTPGTDVAEFVELFGPPGMSLDGYVLVFFNGSGDVSYYALDLDGHNLDVDGLFVAGNPGVSNVDLTFSTNLLQNGADAVALYMGDATDFPNDTPVTEVGLMDAVVYDTNDADDPGLIDVLTPGQPQINEGGGPNGSALDAIARMPDGGEPRITTTYVAQPPTPGCPNAGCGSAFGACGDPATPIHDVQGNGDVSPLNGTSDVVIEGVVVGDFQDTATQLKGFFLQEEDSDADADPVTSEGLFVYDYGFMDVNVGDVVRVMGEITEYYELTEMKNVSDMAICGTGTASPATIELPVTSLDVWEQHEGMLVHIPQMLYVTDNYTQGRYGEVELSVDSRLDQPTNVVLPGADAIALQELNDRSRIQLDDGSTIQNPPVAPYMGADNTLRAGDTIPELEGVLHYSFDTYELHPTEAVSFTRVNEREATPPDAGGTFKVASLNVLNYFSTIDTGVWICGPSGDMECRGADSEEEFIRQRTKIINEILTLDADVLGLMEMENHPTDDALQNLVDGLNDAAGAGTYDFVHTGPIGTDAIKLALIYKPGVVTLVGSFAILDSSVDPTFLDTKNRPSLAQTFMQNATGETLTVVVNHLKSKGSDCNDVGDPDIGDGQGNCNLTRTAAATALANWLAGDPTGSGDTDSIIIGDLNSYAMEDPIAAITGAGYINLIDVFIGADAYSYVFGGQKGYLDHALASPDLASKVTGVVEWHINADEPVALDYNDYNQGYLYTSEPYRASDHDPVIVGFDFQPVVAAFTPSATEVYVDDEVTFTNESTGGEPLNFLWDFGDGTTSTEASPTHSWAEPGTYLVTLTASHDLGSDTASVEILVKPRAVPLETFEVRVATIHWREDVGRFDIIGELELPPGYTRNDLTRDLELTLTIAGESGTDVIALAGHGRVWHFQERLPRPVEGVEIAQALIVWPPSHSPWLPVFILRGELALPGVDQDTRPAEAIVTLSLPLTEGHLMEQIVGEETLTFSVKRDRWYYLAH